MKDTLAIIYEGYLDNNSWDDYGFCALKYALSYDDINSERQYLDIVLYFKDIKNAQKYHEFISSTNDLYYDAQFKNPKIILENKEIFYSPAKPYVDTMETELPHNWNEFFSYKPNNRLYDLTYTIPHRESLDELEEFLLDDLALIQRLWGEGPGGGEDDMYNECCGGLGGGTTTADFAPAVTNTVYPKPNKKKENK